MVARRLRGGFFRIPAAVRTASRWRQRLVLPHYRHVLLVRDHHGALSGVSRTSISGSGRSPPRCEFDRLPDRRSVRLPWWGWPCISSCSAGAATRRANGACTGEDSSSSWRAGRCSCRDAAGRASRRHSLHPDRQAGRAWPFPAACLAAAPSHRALPVSTASRMVYIRVWILTRRGRSASQRRGVLGHVRLCDASRRRCDRRPFTRPGRRVVRAADAPWDGGHRCAWVAAHEAPLDVWCSSAAAAVSSVTARGAADGLEPGSEGPLSGVSIDW